MMQLMQAQIGGLLLGNLPHVVAVYDGDGVGQIAERIEVILGRAVSVVHELALAVHGVAVDVVAYVGAGNAHAAPNIGGGAGILGVLGADAGTAHVIAGTAGGVHAAARRAGGACAAANNRNVIRAEVAGVALISYLVPAVGLLQYGNGRALGNLGAAGNGAVILARALTEVHVAGGGAGGGSGGGAGIVIAGVVIAGVVIAGIPAGVPAAAGGIAGIIVAAGVVVGQSDLEVLGAEVAGVAAIDHLVPAVVAACVLKQGNGGSLGDLRAARHLAVIGAGALAEVDCSGGHGGADGLIGSHVAGIVIVVIIVIIVIAAGKVAPAAGPVAGIAAGGIAAGPAHGRRTAAGGAGGAVRSVHPAHAGNVYLTAGGSAAGSAAGGAAAAGYANIALENVAYVVARSYLIIAVLLAGYGNGGVGGQLGNALGGAAGFRAQAHPVGAVIDNAGGVSGGGS